MDFIRRNFTNLFILLVLVGLGLGAGIAYTNTDVPYVGAYLSQLKPTPTPTVVVRAAAAGTQPTNPQANPGAGAAPVVGQTPIAGGTTGGARAVGGRATTGTVQSIDGKTITVTMQDGTTVKATVSDSTTYQRTQDITLADLKVGDTVVATGQDSGGVLAATLIQVGSAVGGGQAFGGGQQAARGRVVTGAIRNIEGRMLTIAVDGGQTAKVEVGSDTRLRKTTAATLADVKAGEQVVIMGQAGADGVVAAVSVQIGALR